MMDKGWEFLVFWSFLLRRPSVFTLLSFELVKVMCSESKRSYCHYICLLGAPYSNTDLGVPLVGCSETDGGLNPWGTWAQTFCFSATRQDLLSVSSHSDVRVRASSLARAGQTLLLPGCLSGSWRHMLRYMSCVLPLDCFTWSSILGKLGQLQFSHFLVPKQKGALLHGEEGAGDAWGTLRVFRSTAVAVFIGGPLKLRALRYLQVL